MSALDCFPCCAPVCKCPISVCDDVKISACVSRTEVVVNDDDATMSCIGEQDAILYCWRIMIENCSSQTLCHAHLDLDLRWKLQAAAPALNVNPDTQSIFQNCLLTVPFLDRTEVETNLPNVQTVADNAFTGFQDGAALFAGSNDLIPPGKWVVEVCAEIQKSALGDHGIIDCPDPALFPSVLTLRAEIPINVGCPINISTFVGCNPESVTVAALPCNGTGAFVCPLVTP